MEIGPKLRELRIAKNLTQEELADRAELSKGFISQLERDLTSPSIATLVDILQCLGTTINEFFSEDPEEQVVFHYEDYFEKEDTEIRFLIHPGLMNLYLYDQEKGTDFLNTLQEYLKNPGQSSLVAKNLHVHKNTLLYRMGKIKELIGSDLTQGDDYMNMNLSLMIMKYLNML